jgi:hypothetical protein
MSMTVATDEPEVLVTVKLDEDPIGWLKAPLMAQANTVQVGAGAGARVLVAGAGAVAGAEETGTGAV